MIFQNSIISRMNGSRKSWGQMAAFNCLRQGGYNSHIWMACLEWQSVWNGQDLTEIHSNGWETTVLLRAMPMGTQPHYLSNVLNPKDRKEGRTEGRLFCEKSCNIICTCIFASKFCSLHGTTIQCYHKEQNLRTNSHNCLSLPGYLYFDSVLKRQNRKGGWPIIALARFFKMLSKDNKSRDIMQIKLFLSELSDRPLWML